jgi:hypothetical protein
MAYGKVLNASVDELDGETGVYRRVGGRSRWDEGAGIIGSRTSVGRSRARLGARGRYTEEGLLTLGDVEGYGESVENERKDDDGAYLPVGSHDGSGYIVAAEREQSRELIGRAM